MYIYNEGSSCRPAKTHGRYFRNKTCIFVCPLFLSPFLVPRKRHEKMARQNVSGTKLDFRKRGHIFSVMACWLGSKKNDPQIVGIVFAKDGWWWENCHCGEDVNIFWRWATLKWSRENVGYVGDHEVEPYWKYQAIATLFCPPQNYSISPLKIGFFRRKLVSAPPCFRDNVLDLQSVVLFCRGVLIGKMVDPWDVTLAV